jgi:hypothetical protein
MGGNICWLPLANGCIPSLSTNWGQTLIRLGGNQGFAL